NSRKVHKEPVALLGGVAVYLGFVVTVAVAILAGLLPAGSILLKHLIGLLLGGGWLVIGGFLDDRYVLSPRKQIIWPILAVLTVIVAGIGIESFTNPFGGQWFLNSVQIPLFSL